MFYRLASRGALTLIESKMFPMLTQEDMDEAFPGEQPAAVGPAHGNNYTSYTVNSAGMKIVLERLPPHIGESQDPQTGEPTGKLIGDAASLFGRGMLPWPDMELTIQLVEKGVPLYTAQGLTMIQTKTPGYIMAALRELWKRGQNSLGTRSGSLPWRPDAGETHLDYSWALSDLGIVAAGLRQVQEVSPRAVGGAGRHLRGPESLSYSEGREGTIVGRTGTGLEKRQTEASALAAKVWLEYEQCTQRRRSQGRTCICLRKWMKGLQDRL